MLIYATILRNFIMYIICILIFHLTYTNPPPPAPFPLLMKDFDIFLAIRKTLFFPQSPSKSLPYESYKIIASEIFAFQSAAYLENLVFFWEGVYIEMHGMAQDSYLLYCWYLGVKSF